VRKLGGVDPLAPIDVIRVHPRVRFGVREAFQRERHHEIAQPTSNGTGCLGAADARRILHDLFDPSAAELRVCRERGFVLRNVA
jgi:hypothetical protein